MVQGSDDAPGPAPIDDAPGRALELVVFFGEEARVFALPARGEVTLGRDEDNAVRIDHPSVSRHHAVLRLGPTPSIEDLGGPNGTCVRDAHGAHDPRQTQGIRRLARERAELAIGDCVLLGAACLVVRRVAAPEAAFAAAEGAGQAHGFVLRDAAMRAVYEQAERAARAPISVLLLGETGAGKEVLARTIHARSPRAAGPFVGINCAALGETLLEGELFGYERGAFTGATQARPGLFEAAHLGTLFLDEIGEASAATQAKLLRVVEERSVLRIGSRRARPVDVRIVAATNRDPERDVADGRFRADLYFRLSGVTLSIPPLRARPDDVEPLVLAFARAACRQLERKPVQFSEAALAALRAYAWPGNVRELRNAIDRAIILSGEDVLGVEHLPPALRARGAAPAPERLEAPAARADVDAERFRAEVKALERERVRAALEQASGNQTQAAKLLGVSRRTLVARLQEFDLPRPRKR